MAAFMVIISSATMLLFMEVFQSNAIPMNIDGTITKCRGVDVDLAEDHFMHMDECLKKYDATEVLKLDPSNMACFGKCVFTKKGLLDDKGHPHKEKIMGMIKDNLPKVVHDDLDKRMATCLHPNTTEIIDPTDDSCATYLPMMMCVHVAFMEECDEE